MEAGVKYNIDAFSLSWEPIAPESHVGKFVSQCGVIVRDQIPISIQEWHKPKEGRLVSYVDERAKNQLWNTLMSHFTLPEGLTEAEREKVKQATLKKMATQFQTWKKKLWAKYIKAEKKTPEFTGALVKVKDHWDLFVQHKESDEAKERSKINKMNAKKKEVHHVMGPGGYKSGLPKWDAAERKMIAAGVTPVTLSWPPRCRNWFYWHGGKLDPRTGQVIEKASLKGADKELLVAMEEAKSGVFVPDRENDELTRALKNPEHPGRTRGVGVVPWLSLIHI